MNNADAMQTEFALYHTNYKVNKSPSGKGTIGLCDRIVIKLRMEWDWGGLVYPYSYSYSSYSSYSYSSAITCPLGHTALPQAHSKYQRRHSAGIGARIVCRK